MAKKSLPMQDVAVKVEESKSPCPRRPILRAVDQFPACYKVNILTVL